MAAGVRSSRETRELGQDGNEVNTSATSSRLLGSDAVNAAETLVAQPNKDESVVRLS